MFVSSCWLVCVGIGGGVVVVDLAFSGVELEQTMMVCNDATTIPRFP